MTSPWYNPQSYEPEPETERHRRRWSPLWILAAVVILLLMCWGVAG